MACGRGRVRCAFLSSLCSLGDVCIAKNAPTILTVISSQDVLHDIEFYAVLTFLAATSATRCTGTAKI